MSLTLRPEPESIEGFITQSVSDANTNSTASSFVMFFPCRGG